MKVKIVFHDNNTYYFAVVHKGLLHSKVSVYKSKDLFPKISIRIKALCITTIPWWYTMPDFWSLLKIKLKKYFVKKRHKQSRQSRSSSPRERSVA